MIELIDRLIALETEYNLMKSRRNSAYKEHTYYENRVNLISNDIRNVQGELSRMISDKATKYD